MTEPTLALWPEPWGTLLTRLIVREGPFVDDPADHGGATCWGVTLATLRDWRQDPGLSAWDVSLLSQDEAKQCYWVKWITHPACRYDLLAVDYPLAEVIFDSAILFGRARTNKWLQTIANASHSAAAFTPLTVDGVLGPLTRQRLAACDQDELRTELLIARILHHGRRCVAEPSQLRFLNGWLNRAVALLRGD